MNRYSATRVITVWSDDDFDISIEPQRRRGLDLAKLAGLQDFIDFKREPGLGLLLNGIPKAKVREDIAGPEFVDVRYQTIS